MRRILVDHARRRRTKKRGAGAPGVAFDDSIAVGEERGVSLLALDDALADLEALDARQHRVVELKYFAGLSIEEISRVMELSPATVKREWATAKLWLVRALGAREGQ
jgi:RNA polymerase sigma factor (TIGR02999 family)